jgi:radical SAM protein with 4Fe4S-binding SPASM domain
MNPKDIPCIPSYISLRRYEEINIIDLKNDESYVIDDEAYSVLKLINGNLTIKEILAKYPDNKKKEVSEALNDFYELNIITFSPITLKDPSIISTKHISLPDKNVFEPPYLKNLMINITEKCNLTCKHCYITNKNRVDFPIDELKRIIRDFYELQGIKLVLTGGEPLLYSQLRDLLIFLKDLPLIKVLLSNGVLFTDNPEIRALLRDNYFEVFISIDGLKDTHNDFRDAKCFQASIEGIKTLLKEGITVSINTMVHRKNLNEFDDMLELFKSLGTIKNWSIDIPTFENTTPKSIRNKYEIPAKEGGEILKNYGWGEYHSSESYDFACGPNIMAIDVLGVVTKCGFFYNESVGNVFDLGLKKSWELIQEKLNWRISDLQCAQLNCEFIEQCRGGCRYRAYQATGNINGVDAYKCAQFGKLNE